MLGIQIVLILFFLFALVKVIGRYKAGELSLGWFLFWLVFWICAGAAVVRPDSTSVLAEFLGLGRGADLIIYLALALLFYMIFRLNVRLEKIDRQLTKITREDALKKKI